MTAVAGWDPDQYNRFAPEREQPVHDLLDLVEPADRPVVVDLGCGEGRITAIVHARLGAASTLGVDSSPEMLAAAAGRATSAVRFERGDIAEFGEGRAGSFDLVFANASLQWVDDHPAVLGRWAATLRPGGQLAVQVPANADHPSHAVASEIGAELLGSAAPPDPVATSVLDPSRYAEVLDELGFEHQIVRLHVYGHRLPSSADVVEWMKGTALNRFASVLVGEAFDDFVARYRQRLLTVIGERRPYLFAFKRILVWGRLPTRARAAL